MPAEDPGETDARRVRRRVLKWILGAVGFVLLATLMVTWGNSRTRSAWERYKQELADRGETLDWRKFLPGPMPEDSNNFAAVPFLKAVGVWGRVDPVVWGPVGNLVSLGPLFQCYGEWQAGTTSDFQPFQDWLRTNQNLTLPSGSPEMDVLAALEPARGPLNELRAASTRPFARLDLQLPDPLSAERADFVVFRTLAQIATLSASAERALGNADAAMADIRVIHRLGETANSAPNLVNAMIQLAIVSLSIQPFWEGWVRDQWSDEQLQALQELFGKVDLMSAYDLGMRGERARADALIEQELESPSPPAFLMNMNDSRWDGVITALVMQFGPRSLMERSRLTYHRTFDQLILGSYSLADRRVHPERHDKGKAELDRMTAWVTPNTWLTLTALPNIMGALPHVVYVQSCADLAMIVCALERFHNTHGRYPEQLETLHPDWLARPPRDWITGEPYLYRRTPDGRFLLYSVGWNGKDDGGVNSPKLKPGYSSLNLRAGDWVWPAMPVD